MPPIDWDDPEVQKEVSEKITAEAQKLVETQASGIKQKNAELIKEKRELQAKLDPFKDVDPDSISELMEFKSKLENNEDAKLIADGKVEEVVSKRTEKLRLTYEESLKAAREEAERLERQKEAAEEQARLEQEAKKKELDALIGGVSQADGEVNGGEGDDRLAGDKGQPDGDPYATTYYGSPGSGSGTGGYGLSGRSLVGSGKVKQECNQEGRVVVKIVVDRNGRVVQATPGVKGTNNNDPCLLEPAKKTAFLHKWNVDSNAPGQQIGFVVVNFKLGE